MKQSHLLFTVCVFGLTLFSLHIWGATRYAHLDLETNAVTMIEESEIPPDPETSYYVTLPPGSNVAIGSVWDPAKGFLSGITIDPATRKLSHFAFMMLFTQPERTAIRTSADPVVQDFIYMLEKSGGIYLSYPMTINGINYLYTAGLLTETRRDAILAGDDVDAVLSQIQP